MTIAGIDEAGRGALAGPVVAGAVIFPEKLPDWWRELNDSKQLTENRRIFLYNKIVQSMDWGVGVILAQEIDEIGIKAATQKAMNLAVAELKTKPEELLVDGRDKFRFPMPSTDIIRGDETEPVISAASIIAKVTRDNFMKKASEKFPRFGFENHKGYGAAEHLALLEQEIYCELHRKSYDPLRTILTQGKLF